jgi:hypothetical protein
MIICCHLEPYSTQNEGSGLAAALFIEKQRAPQTTEPGPGVPLFAPRHVIGSRQLALSLSYFLPCFSRCLPSSHIFFLPLSLAFGHLQPPFCITPWKGWWGAGAD